MHNFNKDIGALGEDIAESYLRKIGYTILDRNFRCKAGELDIVGKDNEYITFIEVKTRYDTTYGTPGEAVTRSKQYKIYKTAQFYIVRKKLYKFNFRFDVIEIILNMKNTDSSIQLIKDAFQV